MSDTPQTEGKNLVEMLDMLRPVPAPEPISMWPATQGWIWLGLAVLALLALGAYRARQRWQANAYRRAARAALGQAGDDPAAIAAILRRAALAAFPRRDIAALTGADWTGFLRQSCPGLPLDDATAEALTRGPYAPLPPSPTVRQVADHWITRHRREEARP